MKNIVGALFSLLACTAFSGVVFGEVEENAVARTVYVCKTLDSAKEYALLRQEVAKSMDTDKLIAGMKKLVDSEQCESVENVASAAFPVVEKYPTRFNMMLVTKHNDVYVVMEAVEVSAGDSFDICTTEAAAESIAKVFASDKDGDIDDKFGLPEFASKVCRNVTTSKDLRLVRRSEFSDEVGGGSAYYSVSELIVDGTPQYTVTDDGMY